MNLFKIITQEQSALIIDNAAKKSQNIPVLKLGWIKMVRSALGMSGASLARGLGLHRSSLHSLEKSESDGSITIKKLRSVAESMDCELIYAIVPKKHKDNEDQTINNIIINQAKNKAYYIASKANEHMALEDQELSRDAFNKEFNRLTEKLINEMPNDFWDKN